MDDLNRKILQAMQDNQDSESISEEQANVLQLIGRSFKGTSRIIMSFVILMQVIFAGLTIYCAYYLLHSTEVAIKLDWLAGSVGAFIVFAALRLFFFMEINRLSVLREIKRLELQVSLISQNKHRAE